MLWRFLADLTLMVHAAFVAFVVLGGLAVLRWPTIAWVHLPAVAWGVAIEFGGWICPLTPLEVALRQRGGEAGYGGGFIEHYVTPVLYPDGLTHSMQVMLGLTVLAVNVWVYRRVWQRR
jgi:hypothetical protein